jgi:hypothetical protein
MATKPSSSTQTTTVSHNSFVPQTSTTDTQQTTESHSSFEHLSSTTESQTSTQSTTSTQSSTTSLTTTDTESSMTTQHSTDTQTSTTISYSCQQPKVDIVSRTPIYTQPNMKKLNDLIEIISITYIQCSISYQRHWTIYSVDASTGNNINQIIIKNNPTLNYAELVLQPQSLSYGLYRFVFTVSIKNLKNSSQVDTFIQIIPSGLVLSSLKLSQPMYGGTIEITRGQYQAIPFHPFLFTYDIDGVALITSLSFKYSCQMIDSGVEKGFPLHPNTNQTLYLDEINSNPALIAYEQCFNSTGLYLN